MNQGIILAGIYTVLFCYYAYNFIEQEDDYKVAIHYVTFNQTSLKNPSKSIKTQQDYPDIDCTKDSCSWEYYSKQKPLKQSLKQFTDVLIQQEIDEKDPPLKCIPESFGYSLEEAERLFPFQNFPSCQVKTNRKVNKLTLDTKNNELILDCKNGDYWLGNTMHEEWLGYNQFNTQSQQYKNKVKLQDDQEWAFASCDNQSTFAEYAAYSHRVNQEAAERTKSIMEEKQEQINPQYVTRPMTVLFLVFDSLSRRHFYRKLPKTIEYFKQLNQEENYTVFDYKIHNVSGDNSLPNVYPVWTGKILPEMSHNQKHKNKLREEDLLYDLSIWKHLQENVNFIQGWLTLFGAEFCDNYFSFATGKKPQVDHIMQQFWCAAEKLSGFNDLGTFQRCIGNQNSHWYMLNYLHEYTKNYQGLNKWAHVQSLVGHESTGTIAETLDDDLVDFLQKMTSTQDEMLLFIMADHGMRYGDWFKLLDGSHEHKLPSLFIIGSNSLLDDIPFSYDILNHNSYRLTSKLDLNKTLRHITLLPYNQNLSKYHFPGFNDNIVSLFQKKIPNYRSCNDVAIQPYFCSCTVFNKVDWDDIDSDAHIASMQIAKQVIYTINSESVINAKSPASQICKKVSLKEIIDVQWLKLSNSRHFYKILLTVNEHPRAIFEATAMISASYLAANNFDMGYPIIPFYFNTRRMMRLMYIKRQDEYAGLCEDLAKTLEIQPALCICQDYHKILYHQPYLFDISKYEIVQSEKGQSCDKACNNISQKCDKKSLEYLNNCKSMMKHLQCSDCQEASFDTFPVLQDGVCYVNQYKLPKCSAFALNSVRLCSCIKDN